MDDDQLNEFLIGVITALWIVYVISALIFLPDIELWH